MFAAPVPGHDEIALELHVAVWCSACLVDVTGIPQCKAVKVARKEISTTLAPNSVTIELLVISKCTTCFCCAIDPDGVCFRVYGTVSGYGRGNKHTWIDTV